MICKPVNMFRQRNPYTSPSSHGLPVMQRSFKLTRNMILMQFTWIRHCHITVITVTAHERQGALKHRPFDGLFNNLFQASIQLNASMLRGFVADAFGAVTTAIDAPTVFCSFFLLKMRIRNISNELSCDRLFHFRITVSLRGKGRMDQRAFPFSNSCLATQ